MFVVAFGLCFCLLPVLQVSWDFLIPPRVLDLDDRPLVRLCSKKKLCRVSPMAGGVIGVSAGNYTPPGPNPGLDPAAQSHKAVCRRTQQYPGGAMQTQ